MNRSRMSPEFCGFVIICILLCGCAFSADSSANQKADNGWVKWISKSLQGKVTASGELYDYRDLVGAHPSLPFGTHVRVLNPKNGTQVIVRINDRCLREAEYILLVSWRAARTLDLLENGGGRAEIRRIRTLTGIASWYGKKFHGRKTANGEIYNMDELTAAHKELPFNTRVRVVNLNNNKCVVVRINDRGPFVKGRIIDLSRKAAAELGMLLSGIAKVRVDILPPRQKPNS